LTAYFLLERQLARHGTCAVVAPVFDGNGRYNLRFADLKREILSADGYQSFAGPTQVCEVVREEIMAIRNKNEDTYRRGRAGAIRADRRERPNIAVVLRRGPRCVSDQLPRQPQP
jgi:hypothetical protein